MTLDEEYGIFRSIRESQPAPRNQKDQLREPADKLDRVLEQVQQRLQELAQFIAEIRGVEQSSLPSEPRSRIEHPPKTTETTDDIAALLDTKIAAIADTVADAVSEKLAVGMRGTARRPDLGRGLSTKQRRVLKAIDKLPTDALAEAGKELATLEGEPMTEAFTKNFADVLRRKKWGRALYDVQRAGHSLLGAWALCRGWACGVLTHWSFWTFRKTRRASCNS